MYIYVIYYSYLDLEHNTFIIGGDYFDIVFNKNRWYWQKINDVMYLIWTGISIYNFVTIVIRIHVNMKYNKQKTCCMHSDSVLNWYSNTKNKL